MYISSGRLFECTFWAMGDLPDVYARAQTRVWMHMQPLAWLMRTSDMYARAWGQVQMHMQPLDLYISYISSGKSRLHMLYAM